jgi:hypothetical protein
VTQVEVTSAKPTDFTPTASRFFLPVVNEGREKSAALFFLPDSTEKGQSRTNLVLDRAIHITRFSKTLSGYGEACF